MTQTDLNRRSVLKMAGAAAAVPLAMTSGAAAALPPLPPVAAIPAKTATVLAADLDWVFAA
ncbi:MAG: hypothetical protein JNL46_12780 [Sphingosinicella sp.]|nr:hypothetical protein [Sphingosinicella sp.]